MHAYEAKVLLDGGGSIHLDFCSDSNFPLHGASCVAIHLARESIYGPLQGPPNSQRLTLDERGDHDRNGPALLIVAEVDGVMERVGFCSVDQDNYSVWEHVKQLKS